jgi:hypothetical protein
MYECMNVCWLVGWLVGGKGMHASIIHTEMDDGNYSCTHDEAIEQFLTVLISLCDYE